MIHATWHTRYQTGVARVIYNFACDIIGLKNHEGVPVCPGDGGGGGPLGHGKQDHIPTFCLFSFFQRAHTTAVHLVSLREQEGTEVQADAN